MSFKKTAVVCKKRHVLKRPQMSRKDCLNRYTGAMLWVEFLRCTVRLFHFAIYLFGIIDVGFVTVVW